MVVIVSVPNDQLGTAQDAFKVVLKQILKKLSEAGDCNDENNPTTTAAPNVSVKQVSILFQGPSYYNICICNIQINVLN